MSLPTAAELSTRRCKPCEGGVAPLSLQDAKERMSAISRWEISDDGKWIRRAWAFDNFFESMQFLQQVADIAEDEQHHPDLHLTNYRNVAVELTTHAIKGLSENDFIVAAKIDRADSLDHEA